MREKYDVGIFGLWYGRNYGSIITYYALNSVVKSMGYSTVMIRNPLSTENLDYDKMPASHPYLLAREKYTLAPFYHLEDMGQLNKICRSFLLGSDQMWNYHLSKPYQQSYFLEFADDKKIKVSYGTSFGMNPYNGPDDEKEKIKKNLARFTGLSVRDDFSKEILNYDMHLNSEQVIDPVFLCDIAEYRKLINESGAEEHNDYVFAYILDPNAEMGRIVTGIAKKKKVVVVFNELSELNDQKSKLGVDHDNVTFLEHLPIGAWLKCYANAAFVLTDSFHGTCFSVIFKKPFYVVKNKGRGAGRFDCLLGTLRLKEQMSENLTDLKKKIEKTGIDISINYEKVYKRLEHHKKYGYSWLKARLNGDTERVYVSSSASVIDSMNMERCTGCGACLNTCPTDALTLRPDKHGYYKPQVSSDKCVECGKCSNSCPALHLPKKVNKHDPELYAFIAKDKELLDKSSSGGIFSVLAEKVLAKGGSVVGAAWTRDFTVEHILVEKSEDMNKLRKSKYMQSYVGTVYREVKERLEQKRYVLFSGTPCQAAALRSYLGKEYDNLLIIDILCGNAPSSDFFKKYIEDKYQKDITEYEFRHKEENCDFNCTTIQLTHSDGSIEVRKRIRDDDYQRVFHNHVMCSKHCEHCVYQSLPRYGDISIGDFWGISKYDSTLDTHKGVSAVLCNNSKGENLLKQITENDYTVMKKMPLGWLGGNGFAVSGHNYASPKRNLFYKLIAGNSFSDAVNMTLKPYYQELRKQGINIGKVESMFNAKMSYFRFDPAIWQQHFTANAIVLTVPAGKSPPKKYASLYLGKTLEIGRKYTLFLKFKLKTTSKDLHIHIKASENDNLQVIKVYKPKNKEDISDMFQIEFTPDCNIYDEFMIGASQISGEDNYFALEHLYIY